MHGTFSVAVAAASAAVAGFVPHPGSPIHVGSVPRGLVAADFDHDGHADLAVANSGSNDVSILVGDGAGGFREAAKLAVGLDPNRVTAADFDGDGDPDLAVTNYRGPTVSILLGGAGASFGAATSFGVGNGPLGIVAADFNGDRDPDLAVAAGAGVSILLGEAGGGFAPATNFVGGAVPIAVVAADFDRDGDLDLATANEVERPGDVSIFLGDGAGGFGPATHFTAGALSFDIAAADFNGDGDPDLAVANCVSDNVSILLGGAGGTFGAATNLLAGDCPFAGLAAADLNGDGDPDLAVANCSGEISILLGGPGGSFGAAANFPVGGCPYGFAVADLHEDGDFDLALANSQSDSISILLNGEPDQQAPSAPPWVFGRFGSGGVLVLFWGAASDNVVVTGYEVWRGTAAVATVRESPARVSRRLLNRNGPTVLRVIARDGAGNRSPPSPALVVLPLSRPDAAPRVIPAWAWQLLRWQAAPAARRGARPATIPRLVPDWYWPWAAWRQRPYRIRG